MNRLSLKIIIALLVFFFMDSTAFGEDITYQELGIHSVTAVQGDIELGLDIHLWDNIGAGFYKNTPVAYTWEILPLSITFDVDNKDNNIVISRLKAAGYTGKIVPGIFWLLPGTFSANTCGTWYLEGDLAKVNYIREGEFTEIDAAQAKIGFDLNTQGKLATAIGPYIAAGLSYSTIDDIDWKEYALRMPLGIKVEISNNKESKVPISLNADVQYIHNIITKINEGCYGEDSSEDCPEDAIDLRFVDTKDNYRINLGLACSPGNFTFATDYSKIVYTDEFDDDSFRFTITYMFGL